MTIARSTLVLLGTDESSGVTISNNTGATGTVQDALEDDASMGFADVYVAFGATGTIVGSLIVELLNHRVSTTEYVHRPVQRFSLPPTTIGTGIQKAFVGTVQLARYVSARVLNNAMVADAINVFVSLEIFKTS